MKRLLSLITAPLAGLALGALVLGPGCASGPDRLAVLVGLNNASAVAIDTARKDHEARLLADLRRRFAGCPDAPRATHEACVVQAGQEALAASAPERTRLLELALVQQSAAAALETAAACRRDKLSCEDEALRRAEGTVAEIQAELAREGADAGAEGGATDGGSR